MVICRDALVPLEHCKWCVSEGSGPRDGSYHCSKNPNKVHANAGQATVRAVQDARGFQSLRLLCARGVSMSAKVLIHRGP